MIRVHSVEFVIVAVVAKLAPRGATYAAMPDPPLGATRAVSRENAADAKAIPAGRPALRPPPSETTEAR